MEDALVSFETAKLAFKAGFRGLIGKGYKHPAGHYYNHFGDIDGDSSMELAEFLNLKKTSLSDDELYENNKFKLISAPTQSLLQKWLREKHNIHVIPKINDSLSKRFDERSNIEFRQWKWYIYTNINDKDFIYEFFNSKVNYDTYEEALETALQEALKLI